jgi:hypothetical protein
MEKYSLQTRAHVGLSSQWWWRWWWFIVIFTSCNSGCRAVVAIVINPWVESVKNLVVAHLVKKLTDFKEVSKLHCHVHKSLITVNDWYQVRGWSTSHMSDTATHQASYQLHHVMVQKVSFANLYFHCIAIDCTVMSVYVNTVFTILIYYCWYLVLFPHNSSQLFWILSSFKLV